VKKQGSKAVESVEDPAASWVSVVNLRGWKENPRENDEAVEHVKKSIERFGFGAPIVARKADGMIIAGHTRLRAALELRMTEVPVRFLDVNLDEAKALALADNKIAEIANWDSGLLASVLSDLSENGIDLDGLGWDQEEIDLIIQGIDAVSEDEWSDALGGLPEGEKAEFQTMSFVLHDDQVIRVKEALELAKQALELDEDLNPNRNGSALDAICESFVRTMAN
jgi:ParB-like chromosome segregation protein Spo0J